MLASITTNAELPITRAEIIDHLSINGSDYNDLIDGYILAAKELIERESQKVVGLSEAVEHYWQFPYGRCPIILAVMPVNSITKIEYHNGTTWIEWDDANYILSAPARTRAGIYPLSQWPVVSVIRPDAVKVTYSVGYDTTENLPDTIRQAARVLVASSFMFRENDSDKTLTEQTNGFQRLMQSIRAIDA